MDPLVVKPQKSAPRLAKVDNEVWEIIKEWKKQSDRGDHELIFTVEASNDPAQCLQQRISNFFRKSDWKIQSHDFRVSWATECYRRTRDITLVSKYLGHAQISTTQKYIQTDKLDILFRAGKAMGQAHGY